MTADEIRLAAQLTSGIPINSVSGFNWVKDAIKIICRDYSKNGETVTKIVTITEAPASCTLEKTLLSIESVTDSNGIPLSPNTCLYKLNDDDTLTFNKAGTYTIEYKTYPEMPATPASPIKLSSFFEKCLEYYLVYKIRARFLGEGNSDAMAYYDKFLMEMAEGEKARLKKRQKRRMPPGRW